MQLSAEWEVAVERPVYDLTIFKLHCGKLTSTVIHACFASRRWSTTLNSWTEALTGKVPSLVSKLKAILERFQQALSCIDQCFIADQTLEQRWVAEAVLALSPSPAGFSATELACQVRNLGGPAEPNPPGPSL
jgi:hypothetical protein